LIEEARTNLALRCRDLTNAAWTKSNMTTAKTATGPDGVANSATTLTATGANATALQAIVSTSAARISSMFVKRRTGSGVVNITHDNGGTWTAVTVTAAWTRVSNPSTTATDPTVGVRIVTSGDEIDVDMFQHELGAFITSAIPTVASQVTRAVDDISILTSAFPYSATAGTVVAVFDFYYYLADTGHNGGIVGIGGSSPRIRLDVRTGLSRPIGNQIFDGTTVGGSSGPNFSDLAINTFHNAAFGWDAALAGTAYMTWNGLSSSQGAGNSAAINLSGASPMRIGRRPDAEVLLNGHIKRLEYYAARKSNAQLQALST